MVEKSGASTDTSGLVASCVTAALGGVTTTMGTQRERSASCTGVRSQWMSGSPAAHDVPLIDEGREAFTVQAHRVDAGGGMRIDMPAWR